MSATSHTPKDAKVMAAILKDCGVTEYEPRVINQMLEFAYRYVCDLLEDSKVYSEYAAKKQIDVDDVDNTFTNPPPKELILDIAKEKNSQPLPALKQSGGLRLPPDRYCLTQPNYRLKQGLQHTLIASADTRPPPSLRMPPNVTKEIPPNISAFPTKPQPSLHSVQSAPSMIPTGQPPPRQPAPPVAAAQQPSIPVVPTTSGGDTSSAMTNLVQQQNVASAAGKPLFRLVSGAEPGGSTALSNVSAGSTAVKRKFDQLEEDYDNM